MAYLLARSDARRIPLASACADAIVTDPPAGIGFMSKTWDKPGVLGVSGGVASPSTTANRNPSCKQCGGRQRAGKATKACACPSPDWNDLDYRTRDRAAFVAFLTIALAECLRVAKPGARMFCWAIPRTSHWTATAIEDAGWIIEDRVSHIFGQGFPKAKSKLKPAVEDWWLARKPSKRVPELNIDECRIGLTKRVPGSVSVKTLEGYSHRTGRRGQSLSDDGHNANLGRWPANLCLTCCGEEPHVEGCPVAELDRQSGDKCGASGRAVGYAKTTVNCYGRFEGIGGAVERDMGPASRFFYVAKASREDRGEGNTHPTVKPVALMEHLIRLIAKPGDLIVDPFNGSGSTGKAALVIGCRYLGFEREADYLEISRSRLALAALDAERPHRQRSNENTVTPLPGQRSLFDAEAG